MLNDKPRKWDSHIVNRQMLKRIVGVGLLFFFLLAGFWQLLWHTDVNSMNELVNGESLKLFVTGLIDVSHSKTHMSGEDMGLFFTFFVMMQFWNLFNAKYFHTDRSLILDIVDRFRAPNAVKDSFGRGFIWIALVIVLGQILIVSLAGPAFNVSRLSVSDWLWIILLTSPVLVVADIVRTVMVLRKKR